MSIEFLKSIIDARARDVLRATLPGRQRAKFTEASTALRGGLFQKGQDGSLPSSRSSSASSPAKDGRAMKGGFGCGCVGVWVCVRDAWTDESAIMQENADGDHGEVRITEGYAGGLIGRCKLGKQQSTLGKTQLRNEGGRGGEGRRRTRRRTRTGRDEAKKRRMGGRMLCAGASEINEGCDQDIICLPAIASPRSQGKFLISPGVHIAVAVRSTYAVPQDGSTAAPQLCCGAAAGVEDASDKVWVPNAGPEGKKKRRERRKERADDPALFDPRWSLACLVDEDEALASRARRVITSWRVLPVHERSQWAELEKRPVASLAVREAARQSGTATRCCAGLNAAKAAQAAKPAKITQ